MLKKLLVSIFIFISITMPFNYGDIYAAPEVTNFPSIESITPPKSSWISSSPGSTRIVIGDKQTRSAKEVADVKGVWEFYNGILKTQSAYGARTSLIPGEGIQVSGSFENEYNVVIQYTSPYSLMSSVVGNLEAMPTNKRELVTQPLNVVDDVTYFLDYLVIRFFDEFIQNSDSMPLDELVELSNNVDAIWDEKNTARWYSVDLTKGLQAVSDKHKLDTPVNTIAGVKEYVKASYKTKTTSIAKQVGDNIVAERYTNKILNDKLLTGNASSYDKYKAALYALSMGPYEDDIQKTLNKRIDELTGNVTSPIKFVKETDSNAKTLNNVLTDIVRDGSGMNSGNGMQAKQLFSIVAQRGSRYSLDSSNPVTFKDTNWSWASESAVAVSQYKQVETWIKELLSSRANDLSSNDDDAQMRTINLRLQYHYWAMQTYVIGTSTADELSTSTSGISYFRDIEPVTVSDKFLAQPTQYINFMNAANEIPHMREVFMKGLAGDVISKSGNFSQYRNQFIYLRQLKNGITFLEGLDKKDIDVSPIVKYWYEAVEVKSGGETRQMSLEDLYNESQEYTANIDLDVYSNEGKEAKPLSHLFDLDTNTINDYLKMGISLTATFIPLKTNVYAPDTYKSITNEDFYRFHYQWGYYRKALYMDNNVKAAVDNFTFGKKGTLKVATLADILQPERDLLFYIDDNFYNVNKLAEMQDKTLNRLTNNGPVDGNFWEQIWDRATQIFSIDVTETTKTGNHEKYSKSLGNITQYEKATGDKFGVTASDVDTSRNYSVLGKEGIWQYVKPLKDDANSPTGYDGEAEYSVVQPFAIVSAIYRDKQLYSFLNNNVQRPVFISSPDLYSVPGAGTEQQYSLFNYALLKNLKSNQLIRYSSILDKNSPLYMDIYGNILTESGFVVVPAAANATLQESYNPYTAAFLTTYGSDYKLPTSYEGVGLDAQGQDGLIDVLEENEEEEVWDLQNQQVGYNTKVDINRLSTASASSMETLFNIYYTTQFKSGFKSDLFISNVLMEVLRGAPMEDIDKDFENLNTARDLSRSGIVQGVKLDRLKDALGMKSQNSILAIPNLAFVDKIEYVMLFLYKFMMIFCIIMILVQIFVAAMQMRASMNTIIGMIMTVAITLATIFTVPLVFSVTYYQANKVLLQNETETIAMLNYEKSESGVEIGMTTVGAPESETKLLMKVHNVKVPWYDLFPKIIYAPVLSNLTDLYKSYLSDNLAMDEKVFELKSNTLYMDLDKLFASSDVMFSGVFGTDESYLYQTMRGDIPASFYTPYYVFLDSLISNVNTYNSSNNMYSYTSGLYKGGKTKSLGLIKDYLLSPEFAEEETEDVLFLRQIYGLDVNRDMVVPFDEEDFELMRGSQWLDVTHDVNDVQPRVDKLNKEARRFVLEHQNLLGNISDETFLKMMSLHLAMMHNKLFSVDGFSTIEIYNLSVDDLTRLSVAPTELVMEGSPLSYTRFIYNNAGETGIYLSAILSIINYMANWIKPLITLVIFITMFMSFFVQRILLRKKTDNLVGYLKVFAILCSLNVLHALSIKFSMWLPEVLPIAACLLVQIFLQLLFLAAYMWMTFITAMNWRDFASEKLNITARNVKDFFTNPIEREKRKGMDNADENSGWRWYKMIKDKDKARKYTLKRDRGDIE